MECGFGRGSGVEISGFVSNEGEVRPPDFNSLSLSLSLSLSSNPYRQEACLLGYTAPVHIVK